MSRYKNYTKEQLIQKIKQLESKKYGLVWDDEKEPEKVVLECQNNIPILKKIDEKTIKTDIQKSTNILIEGDNYHALQVLNYTHKGQIDVIYIDPPYNTGKNDFTYNDKFVDKEDGYRHSKWLNFMSKRLKLAHNLLKESGVIFISIDDNEVAQLKLLCDDIFDITNYIATVVRKTKLTSNKGTYFSPSHEYILCYSKNVLLAEPFDDPYAQSEEKYTKLFSKEDERGKYNEVSLYMPSLDARPNQRYYIKCPDGGMVITPYENKMFRWKEETLQTQIQDNRVVFKKTKTSPLIDKNGNQSKWNIYTKIYLHERLESGLRPSTTIDKWPNSNGSKELIKMGINFSFSKPKELIIYLIKILNLKQDAIILDFFAGSGTTGHAALELNREDGGNRQCILCTNNENNICEEVTYPRISKVINGYTTPKGIDIEGLGGNIDYYKTDLIPTNGISNITDSTREELTKKAGNMIAIKENTHFMVELCEHYQIFINEATKKQTAIYFTEDLSYFDELIAKTKSHFTKLYIFSYGKIDKSSYKYLGKNYQIEDIPEPIIEIYKEINKEGIL